MTTHGGHHLTTLTFENITTSGATDLAHGEQFNILSDGHGPNNINVYASPNFGGTLFGQYRDALPVKKGKAGPFTAGDGPDVVNDGDWSATGCTLQVFGFHNEAVDGLTTVQLVGPR